MVANDLDRKNAEFLLGEHQRLKKCLQETKEKLEDIMIEKHTMAGSDDFFEGVAHACAELRPKIRAVVTGIDVAMGRPASATASEQIKGGN